mmetsp:Transcript_56929/g.140011  ORF Transcript_56929/g.140011 Transcript_56929/m.140011 type:complete len:238 (+) Transcript_56929:272-985(+)
MPNMLQNSICQRQNLSRGDINVNSATAPSVAITVVCTFLITTAVLALSCSAMSTNMFGSGRRRLPSPSRPIQTSGTLCWSMATRCIHSNLKPSWQQQKHGCSCTRCSASTPTRATATATRACRAWRRPCCCRSSRAAVAAPLRRTPLHRVADCSWRPHSARARRAVAAAKWRATRRRSRASCSCRSSTGTSSSKVLSARRTPRTTSYFARARRAVASTRLASVGVASRSLVTTASSA